MLNDIRSKNEYRPFRSRSKRRGLNRQRFYPGKRLGEIIELLFLCVLQIPGLNRKDILIEIAKSVQKAFPE